MEGLVNYNNLINIDILCVGANISSLYFAHKLCEDEADVRMVIIDSNEEIGGGLESIPLSDKDVIYAAEGGPSRLFKKQHLIHELLKHYCLISSPLLNSQIVTDTSSNVAKELEKIYKNYSDKTMLSNVTTILKYFDWNDLKRYGDAVGYMSYANNMNLDLFFARNNISGSQVYIEGGITTLLKRMVRRIECKFPIHLNTPVMNIEYIETCGRYIINNKWATTSLIFTGTPQELFHINTLSNNIKLSKKLLVNAVANTHNLMSVFIEFKEPWWTRSQIGYTFRSYKYGIGTMTYFSSNTIMIVADERKADTMVELLNFKALHYVMGKMTWQKPFIFSKLVEYLKHNIKNIIDEAIDDNLIAYLERPGIKINKIDRMALKYTKNAFINYGMMSENEYKELFDTLNFNNNNFHMIGGYYIPDSHGFINDSLKCVQRNYLRILILLEAKQNAGYPDHCNDEDSDSCNENDTYKCGC